MFGGSRSGIESELDRLYDIEQNTKALCDLRVKVAMNQVEWQRIYEANKQLMPTQLSLLVCGQLNNFKLILTEIDKAIKKGGVRGTQNTRYRGYLRRLRGRRAS